MVRALPTEAIISNILQLVNMKKDILKLIFKSLEIIGLAAFLVFAVIAIVKEF